MSEDQRNQRIRELNDRLRTTFCGGRIMLTRAVQILPPDTLRILLARVKSFNDFDYDCDPHHEHDFCSVEVDGEKYFAKIDYYDRSLQYGSENPADPAVTTRVLTVMHSSDY